MEDMEDLEDGGVTYQFPKQCFACTSKRCHGCFKIINKKWNEIECQKKRKQNEIKLIDKLHSE